MVSNGKLGTTAGEQLAYLTEEAQRELWDKLGLTVAKTEQSDGEITEK